MTEHPFLSRLACLREVFAPAHIALVGAGNGAGVWAQWLLQQDAPALLIEAGPEQHRLLAQRLNIRPNTSHHAAQLLVAPEHGEHPFYTTTLSSENGLLPPDHLTSLWPNLHPVQEQRVLALTLAEALAAHAVDAAPLWLIIDCLPAAPLLTSAGGWLQHADVVLARVVLPNALPHPLPQPLFHDAGEGSDVLSPLPLVGEGARRAGEGASDLHHTPLLHGATLDELAQALPGMQHIALHPTRHPAIAHALFVRDTRAALRQHTETALAAQSDLQQQLQQALQTRDALQTQLTQQHDAAQALQQQLNAETQAKTELQRRLEQAFQTEQRLEAELLKKNDAAKTLQTALDAQTQANSTLQQQLQQATAAPPPEPDPLPKAALDALFKQQSEHIAEALADTRHFLDSSLKRAIINASKQLTAVAGLQSHLDIGKLLPVHIERTTWPVSADFAFYLVERLEYNEYPLIIEFGSGLSTLVIAHALNRIAANAGNQASPTFISFDHLEPYYQQTRARLTQAGLQDTVQLHHAPLADWHAPDGSVQPYYTCQPVLAELAKQHASKPLRILVVVDGPPAATGKHARYPAWPLLAEHFPGAQLDLLLDDYIRRDEKEIVERWQHDIAAAGLHCAVTTLAFEKDACLLQISPP